METKAKIRAAADFLATLQQGEREAFVVILTKPAGPHTETAYASSLERGEGQRLLLDSVVGQRAKMLPRVMGEAIPSVPDAYKIACFEMLETIQKASISRVPKEVWRDLLLVFCAGMAHDQGVSREDFERTALEVAQEEWSTPGTEGQAAMAELLGKMGAKPDP